MKRHLGKFITQVLIATMASFGLVSLAPIASADTPGCVTKREFRAVGFWDSKASVHSSFDTRGLRVRSYGGQGETRQYRTCGGAARSYITVDFESDGDGVWFKWMYWQTPATATSDSCVTPREFRMVHKGMTKGQVNAIFDTEGRATVGGSGGYQRRYQTCDRPHRLVEIGLEIPPQGRERVYGKSRMSNPG